MSDTAKRDAVLEEFAHDAGVHRVWGVAGMADEILRLRDENASLRERADRAERILAVLREPSGRVIEWEDPAFPLSVADQEILAAVKAAEQEVGRE